MICGGFAWAYADEVSAAVYDAGGMCAGASSESGRVWLGYGHDHAEGYGDGDGWDIGRSFTQVVA